MLSYNKFQKFKHLVTLVLGPTLCVKPTQNYTLDIIEVIEWPCMLGEC